MKQSDILAGGKAILSRSLCCGRPVWSRIVSRREIETRGFQEYVICSGCYRRVGACHVHMLDLPMAVAGISLIPTFGSLVEDNDGKIQIHTYTGQRPSDSPAVVTHQGEAGQIVQGELGRVETDNR